jgi:hypothetical protein
MTENRFVRCGECGALNEPQAVFCSRCGASLPSPAHGVPRARLNSTSVALGASMLLGLLLLVFVLYSTIARGLDKSASVAPYAEQKGIPASIVTTTTVKSGGQAVVVTDGSQTGPAATTTTTEPPILVRPKATVASSALKGTSTESFQATNLVDNDLSTAWVEGAKGTGLGEWVRFQLTKPTLLSRIEIANGYQKDSARFETNPRVRLVNIEFSSGATLLVELKNTQELQFLTPPGEAVEWVKLVIVSVYPGVESDETALSEVRLFEKAD